MRSVELNVVVFLMLLGGLSFAAADQPTAKNTYDNYKVIYERNMFSKDRRPPREPQSTQRKKVQTTTVLSIYVLRGTSAEAGRAHKFAFVEEKISGDSNVARIGTKVLSGKIKDIQMDYVLFEEDGATRKVKVGEEFGETSSTETRDVAESAGEDEAADTTSPKEEQAEESSSGEESDLLKKLMERRKRELGT